MAGAVTTTRAKAALAVELGNVYVALFAAEARAESALIGGTIDEYEAACAEVRQWTRQVERIEAEMAVVRYASASSASAA